MTTNKKHHIPSPESVVAAENIAKSTQKPGQSKEQTKLIAQGIQKGIEQFKKQQKIKARAADKAKKQIRKSKLSDEQSVHKNDVETKTATTSSTLPWLLLVASWLGFVAFVFLR